MTPQEREMIESVFGRLASLAGGAKDREAESLIAERMRAIPDAAYNLVEAVVVQEMAIKEKDARIAELESRLARASQPQAQPQAQPAAFGQRSNPWGRGSVPSTVPPQQQYPQQQAAPWGGQPSAGGSFLRTAAGAAVGVAGGMLLANSISSMFGGGGGSAHASPVSDTAAAQPAGAEPGYDTTIADDSGFDGGGFDGGFDGGEF